MFEFTDDHGGGGTILFTGDSTGDILDSTISQSFKTHPKKWTIMKVSSKKDNPPLPHSIFFNKTYLTPCSRLLF